jgi:NAD+ synthase (glutamine-hydrolysing)
MLNLTLAQLNPKVGDLEGNKKKILSVIEDFHKESHLIVFPELVICGYPAEDLLLRIDFLRACKRTLQEIIEFTDNKDCLVVLGFPEYEGDLYNSLDVIHRGESVALYRKRKLPNYSVFDELRYFREGEEPLIVEVGDYRLGFSICEDIWYPEGSERESSLAGAELHININASPFYYGKIDYKRSFLKARAEDSICYLAYVNLAGGSEELVFDGRSMVIDPMGNIIAQAEASEEDVITLSLELEEVRRRRLLDLRWRNAGKDARPIQPKGRVLLGKKEPIRPTFREEPKGLEELYKAIVVGIRDYASKNGFDGVVLGLSGGIDSSLVASLACDALGRERVLGLFLPTRFSSIESLEDAKELAQNLGIEFHTVPIDSIFEVYREEIATVMNHTEFDVADENIQARIRANILFYFSNKYGYLVLSTSNKSESAVGYTTIYGDMAGGFAPIKDLYKTQVYELARYRNSLGKVIPDRVFQKPPSAELRPDQRDQDTLPPYEELDRILRMFIEDNLSVEDMVRKGMDRDTVKRVVGMVKSAEYKRKQAPIGLKLSSRAFGKDWRMPIINGFSF